MYSAVIFDLDGTLLNTLTDLANAGNHTLEVLGFPTHPVDAYRYLVGLIRALPEGYRRVLELKCVEEESNREIARRLGLKESTVATRVLRGRALLAEALEKEGYVHG